MQFGKTGLNPESFEGWKKDDFKKAYLGKVPDIDEAWKAIQKALPKKSKSKKDESGKSGE